MLKVLLLCLSCFSVAPVVWAAMSPPNVTVLTTDEFNRRY